MKKPEWPGIATALGIIVALMIAFDLSKWQQLATGIFALVGGALAYKGAMEKVEVDREENRREFSRRQLAQFLKLEIAIQAFKPQVQVIQASLDFYQGGGIKAENFKIVEPPEIAEAWENLDVFPRSLIRQIATIRCSVRRVDVIRAEVEPDRVLFGDPNEEGTRFSILFEHINEICDACGIIVDGLGPEIERLAPQLSHEERIKALFGDPPLDDDLPHATRIRHQRKP